MLILNGPKRWVDWPGGGGAAFEMRGLQESERRDILEATCTVAVDENGEQYLQRDEIGYAIAIAKKVVSNWRGVSINDSTAFSIARLELAMQSRDFRNFVVEQARKLGAVVDEEEDRAKKD